MPYYLTALLISNLCLFAVDRRFSLNVWRAPYAKVVVSGIVFFLVFDLLGIAMNIFTHNPERIFSLNPLGPKLPIEELLFLHLLVYVTSLTHVLISKRVSR